LVEQLEQGRGLADHAWPKGTDRTGSGAGPGHGQDRRL